VKSFFQLIYTDEGHILLRQKKTVVFPLFYPADLTLDAGRGLTEIVSRYTQTFLWLQAYDEGLLEDPTGEAGGDLPTAEHATQSLL
jgi:hypothetical protein